MGQAGMERLAALKLLPSGGGAGICGQVRRLAAAKRSRTPETLLLHRASPGGHDIARIRARLTAAKSLGR